jgi:hypothetical protein
MLTPSQVLVADAWPIECWLGVLLFSRKQPVGAHRSTVTSILHVYGYVAEHHADFDWPCHGGCWFPVRACAHAPLS